MTQVKKEKDCDPGCENQQKTKKQRLWTKTLTQVKKNKKTMTKVVRTKTNSKTMTQVVWLRKEKDKKRKRPWPRLCELFCKKRDATKGSRGQKLDRFSLLICQKTTEKQFFYLAIGPKNMFSSHFLSRLWKNWWLKEAQSRFTGVFSSVTFGCQTNWGHFSVCAKSIALALFFLFFLFERSEIALYDVFVMFPKSWIEWLERVFEQPLVLNQLHCLISWLQCPFQLFSELFYTNIIIEYFRQTGLFKNWLLVFRVSQRDRRSRYVTCYDQANLV